ncbi:mechanosensitive ion channel domain-containing protein [Anderseniella sp. Alg231-50]|uniref:mechanosensitive ion channel domain-containing protein n=1 Tax=Anderseniella sp. Alg231-50 TaxID=1922226 RepID=UPI000D54CEC9
MAVPEPTGWRRIICAVVLAMVFTLHTASLPVAAQDTTGSTNVVDAIKPALEKAAREGATVIVVGNSTDAAKAGQNANDPGISDILNRALFRFKLTLGNAEQALGNMKSTLAKASPDDKINWLFYAFVAGLAGVVLGRLAAKPVANWVRDVFAPRVPEVPTSRQQKIGYLLFRGTTFGLFALFVAAVGSIIVIIYAGDHMPSRATGLAVVWTYMAYRLMRSIYINILVPSVPNYRMINMDDAEAERLYQTLLIATAISLSIIGVCVWMDHLGLDVSTHKLMLMFGSLISALLFCGIAVVHRSAVAQAIAGFGSLDEKPFWLRALARSWHVILITYVLGAWAVSAVRLLLDQPASSGLVGAPLAVLIAALVVYGITLVLIDKLFAGHSRMQQLAAAAAEAEQEGVTAGTSGEQVEATDGDTGSGSVFKGLIEHASALGIAFLGLAAIAQIWGINFGDPSNWVARSLDVIVVLFGAYIAYRAVELWIDSKVEEEDPHAGEEAEVGGEPGGAGATRLATLLPIFRNFLLITIVTIAGMIALSEMGVNIAPLFAGAGVVGLAIGFGAQTLIRDIFSGAFFLVDDAFRKGEYIDIGSAKGTVEKISIRSMQLRHHNGPLNTIPFGEIKQLTNFSRDWVMMKLPLRLTYDTDIERVRKLVKKLGIELLDHPEIGDKFMQPLKSQGVKQMDDSAMIVRVKFMTKPGDQFDVRKVVYHRIQELFEANGIHFAHREVTVRIADDDKKSDTVKEKAAVGAVQTVIEKPA